LIDFSHATGTNGSGDFIRPVVPAASAITSFPWELSVSALQTRLHAPAAHHQA
jgi:hypothetical protein